MCFGNPQVRVSRQRYLFVLQFLGHLQERQVRRAQQCGQEFVPFFFRRLDATYFTKISDPFERRVLGKRRNTIQCKYEAALRDQDRDSYIHPLLSAPENACDRPCSLVTPVYLEREFPRAAIVPSER